MLPFLKPGRGFCLLERPPPPPPPPEFDVLDKLDKPDKLYEFIKFSKLIKFIQLRPLGYYLKKKIKFITRQCPNPTHYKTMNHPTQSNVPHITRQWPTNYRTMPHILQKNAPPMTEQCPTH